MNSPEREQELQDAAEAVGEGRSMHTEKPAATALIEEEVQRTAVAGGREEEMQSAPGAEELGGGEPTGEQAAMDTEVPADA